MFFVAYNDFGDLVAEAYDLDSLADEIEDAGYYEDEVFIGRVAP